MTTAHWPMRRSTLVRRTASGSTSFVSSSILVPSITLQQSSVAGRSRATGFIHLKARDSSLTSANRIDWQRLDAVTLAPAQGTLDTYRRAARSLRVGDKRIGCELGRFLPSDPPQDNGRRLNVMMLSSTEAAFFEREVCIANATNAEHRKPLARCAPRLRCRFVRWILLFASLVQGLSLDLFRKAERREERG